MTVKSNYGLYAGVLLGAPELSYSVLECQLQVTAA